MFGHFLFLFGWKETGKHEGVEDRAAMEEGKEGKKSGRVGCLYLYLGLGWGDEVG